MTSLSPSSHVAIAGAGLLGRLLAWRLLRDGHHVSLFEAGDLDTPPAAAWTAAGMVAPQCETAVSEASIHAMGAFALERWPQWLDELGSGELWHANGSLVVAHPKDMASLTQFRRDLEHALGAQAALQALDHDGLHRLEPDLAPGLRQGLYLENEAHLDNRELLIRLLAEIRALGGECHARCPVETAPGELVTPGGRQRFDWVIDCRGTGARPRHPSIRGVRGETLHVRTSEVHLSRPVRLMHPRYQLYVVPKSDHRFVIGATQIESEDRSPVSLQSSLELGSALFTLSPAFAEARILEQGVNLRPAFHDNLPRVVQQPGLTIANGLFRHGYLLAPAVACHVLAQLDGRAERPFAATLDMPLPQEVTS